MTSPWGNLHESGERKYLTLECICICTHRCDSIGSSLFTRIPHSNSLKYYSLRSSKADLKMHIFSTSPNDTPPPAP